MALNHLKQKVSKTNPEVVIEIDKINTAIIKLSSQDDVLNMNRAAQHLLRVSDSKKHFVKTFQHPSSTDANTNNSE